MDDHSDVVQPQGEVEKFGPVFCPSCNKNCWPYQEPAAMSDGDGNSNGGMVRMVDKCSACDSVLGVHGANKARAAVPIAPVPAAQPWTVPSAPAPSDFLGQCGARLQVIELELARMAGLQAEAKQLRKLLGKGTKQ